MKQKLSICIFLLICFVGILYWATSTNKIKNSRDEIFKQKTTEINSEMKQEIKQGQLEQQKSIPSHKELKYYLYMIYQDGERLTVYESDNTTVFMETDIFVDDLPQDVNEKLQMGIGFQSEEELYDFLESYSS